MRRAGSYHLNSSVVHCRKVKALLSLCIFARMFIVYTKIFESNIRAARSKQQSRSIENQRTQKPIANVPKVAKGTQTNTRREHKRSAFSV